MLNMAILANENATHDIEEDTQETRAGRSPKWERRWIFRVNLNQNGGGGSKQKMNTAMLEKLLRIQTGRTNEFLGSIPTTPCLYQNGKYTPRKCLLEHLSVFCLTEGSRWGKIVLHLLIIGILGWNWDKGHRLGSIPSSCHPKPRPTTPSVFLIT